MLPAQRFLFNQLENLERMYENRLEKKVLRDSTDPFNLHDRRFIELFRLNKDIVSFLFDQLVHHMVDEQRNTKIPSQTRILIALRFFASGNYQRGIGEEFLLSTSQQVVSRCINEVAICINQHLGPAWIKFPLDPQSKDQTKRGFMEKAGFPGIIGCIDCTHIALIGPSEDEFNYVNRKGFHSKNVQIICSYDLQITNINARYPGSVNDAFIWRSSQIRHLLQQEYNWNLKNQWLLGDSGYPLEPWLLTPFENNADANIPEGNYNRSHKITRSIVERCIGRLKLVFRCLLGERKLRYSPEKVRVIVNACAVLHNLSIRAGVAYDDIDFNFVRDDNMNNINVHGQVLNEGRQTRQQVVQRYFM